MRDEVATLVLNVRMKVNKRNELWSMNKKVRVSWVEASVTISLCTGFLSTRPEVMGRLGHDFG
jgi:hypothetical protein